MISNAIAVILLLIVLSALGFTPGQALTPWMRGLIGIVICLAFAGWFFRHSFG